MYQASQGGAFLLVYLFVALGLCGCWVWGPGGSEGHGGRAQAARVFAEAAAARAVRRPDASVYAALLTFAARQGVPEQALDVWAALQEACTPPR